MDGVAMRKRPISVAILLMALTATGCATDGPDTQEAITSEVTGESMETEFAPALNIDLAQMERQASGLYVRDLEIGDGAFATPGDSVSVHYTG